MSYMSTTEPLAGSVGCNFSFLVEIYGTKEHNGEKIRSEPNTFRQSIAGMLLIKPLGKIPSQSYAVEVESREHRRVPLSTDTSVT